MNEKTVEITPCGKLYAQGREYWLVTPYPIDKDSWQQDNERRFLVVPDRPYKKGVKTLYPHARHIVINGPYLLDYAYDPELQLTVIPTEFNLEQETELLL